MTDQEKTDLKVEIQHIFDSGANEMRIFNMIEMFLDRRDKAINYTRCCEALTCVKCNGYGYIVDENGRRKDHCKKCDGWG